MHGGLVILTRVHSGRLGTNSRLRIGCRHGGGGEQCRASKRSVTELKPSTARLARHAHGPSNDGLASGCAAIRLRTVRSVGVVDGERRGLAATSVRGCSGGRVDVCLWNVGSRAQ